MKRMPWRELLERWSGQNQAHLHRGSFFGNGGYVVESNAQNSHLYCHMQCTCLLEDPVVDGSGGSDVASSALDQKGSEQA